MIDRRQYATPLTQTGDVWEITNKSLLGSHYNIHVRQTGDIWEMAFVNTKCVAGSPQSQSNDNLIQKNHPNVFFVVGNTKDGFTFASPEKVKPSDYLNNISTLSVLCVALAEYIKGNE